MVHTISQLVQCANTPQCYYIAIADVAPAGSVAVVQNNHVLLFVYIVETVIFSPRNILNYITKSISPACRKSCWNNAVDPFNQVVVLSPSFFKM